MKKSLIFLLVMGICLPAIADDMPVKEDGMMFPDGRIMQPSDFDPTPEPIPEGMILPEEEMPVAPEDVKAEAVEQQPEIKAEPKAEEHKQASRRRRRRANSKPEERQSAPAETGPAPFPNEMGEMPVLADMDNTDAPAKTANIMGVKMEHPHPTTAEKEHKSYRKKRTK